MNRLLLLILAVAFSGCASVDTKQDRCALYEQVYTAYLASTQIGRPLSSEEVMAATGAALFLRLYCGWLPESNNAGGAKRGRVSDAVDANGVLVIKKP